MDRRLLALLREAVAELAPEQAPGFSIELEVPRREAHGDLTTPCALALGKALKRPPMALAQELIGRLSARLRRAGLDSQVRLEAAPPGFLNVHLAPSALQHVVADLLRSPDRYGRSSAGRHLNVLIEFVSANPTGPLTVAHGRQAAVGDALANLLSFVGYRVKREYFLNDEGRQIHLLGQSLHARYRELLGQPAEIPEDGYRGEYLKDIAKGLVHQVGRRWLEPTPDVLRRCSEFAVRHILHVIKHDLALFGVHFDLWASQHVLTKHHEVKRGLDLLKKRGRLYEREGALWFQSTQFGDDKDRVVVKSDGSYTYLAPDIAYHRSKYRRGFKRLINLWGPDHHGYIPRVRAAVQAMGFDPRSLQVIIVQLVSLYRGGEQVPMSTRAGEFVTLREVIQEVGKDATRFFYLLRRVDSHLDFDLELAKQKTLDNPVFYVQYAHARISNILAFGRQKRVQPNPRQANLALLTQPEELRLMRLLWQFPSTISVAADRLEPHFLVAYLRALAEGFHLFYDQHRVIGDEPALTQARLALIASARTVLATGLGLLGVSAPERM